MYTQLNKKTSWTNEQDYILENGEPGYDTKEHILKIGNGESSWEQLAPARSLRIETQKIVKNGVYSNIEYNNIEVSVEGGDVVDSAKPIEVATEQAMDELLASATDQDVGSVYKYIGGGTKYEAGALYILEVQ